MLDFFTQVQKVEKKRGIVYCEISPSFKVGGFKDLMVRGKSFYAIWKEDEKIWSTDENDVWRMVDKELYNKAEEFLKQYPDAVVTVKSLNDSSTGMWDKFQKHLKTIPDKYHQLDTTVTFANTEVKDRKQYISKRLDYNIERAKTPAYDKLMSTLYDKENRQRLEWAIGSIIAGDSKDIQKFIVLYGSPGTGKSTVLHIIEKLFDGYYTMFNAKDLVSKNNQFAMEQFASNPLVAIQHDGDLSKISDNSMLNSLVSHEKMRINAKFKSPYTERINSFLFMGSNSTVGMSSINSGLKRRCIEVDPTGNLIPPKEFNQLERDINYELGGIAYKCLKTYEKLGINAYKNGVSNSMLSRTNYIFNFFQDNMDDIELMTSESGYIKLTDLYRSFQQYCSEIGLEKPINRLKFREEAENYFENFYSEMWDERKHIRNAFVGLKADIFENQNKAEEPEKDEEWINLESIQSIFDNDCQDCQAQYAKEDGTPKDSWDNIKTSLKDIDTKKLHYVRVPNNHIVIDFDIKDENGNKSLEANLEAANKFPPTYAEVSKSGSGIHLHYIYEGDVSKLSRIYSKDIEIKVFTGKSSLRRKLTLCNQLPISTISSGLPFKKVGDNLLDFKKINDEKHIRNLILKALRKDVHAGTKPSVDFIYKVLDDAYKSGMPYDIRDLRPKILTFAMNSTNHSEYCVKLVNKMHYNSDNPSLPIKEDEEKPIIFLDVEVFPNLFLVNWKKPGDENKCIRMINPTPDDIENLVMNSRIIGFNNRRYDNHILYARMMGYSNMKLYELSQRIINGSSNALFGEAYNLSYADVYDFSSSFNKKSLKKWEIELGLHHQELGFKWDQPVPEDKWSEVAEYCDNDVISTEKVYDHLSGDWAAREILAELSGLSVNHSTNAHSTQIIFGDDPNPQKEFNYTDLSEEFPGYKFDKGKSTYKGFEVGEGGYAASDPGVYYMVALLDIESMHPSTIEFLQLFGPKYTKRFVDIKDARLMIKHGEYDKLANILDGKLVPYIDRIKNDKAYRKAMSNALKTVINSVYGLTAAKFDNKFRDPRNIDNIVAKRGALFMVDLREEVEKRGFHICHIKTDSVKIPNATPEIIKFVQEYGLKRGYKFAHEATYDRMCIVNKAAYIAKYATEDRCMELYGYVPEDNAEHPGQWTATATQFQIPYVFKTLFSKEPLTFKDMCEVKSVSTSLYLDMNETYPDVTEEEKILDKLKKLKEPTDEDLKEIDRLKNIISEGHNYVFVGRIGEFCPIKEGSGGGLLCREGDDKFSAATGAKGYRWLESETVRNNHLEDSIDESYYIELVDEAVDDISQYCDFESFVA